MKIIAPVYATKVTIESNGDKNKRSFFLGYFDSMENAELVIDKIEDKPVFIKTLASGSLIYSVSYIKEKISKGVIFENENEVLSFISMGIPYEEFVEQVEYIGRIA